MWDLIACDSIVERGAEERYYASDDELFPDLR